MTLIIDADRLPNSAVDNATLDAALARWDGLMTAAEYDDHFDRMIMARAEREAEGAWLRSAESFGWQHAMLDARMVAA